MVLAVATCLTAPAFGSPPTSFGDWSVGSGGSVTTLDSDPSINYGTASVEDTGIVERTLNDAAGNTYIQLIVVEGASGDNSGTAPFSDESFVKMKGTGGIADHQHLLQQTVGNGGGHVGGPTPNINEDLQTEISTGEFTDPAFSDPNGEISITYQIAQDDGYFTENFSLTRAHDAALNEDFKHLYFDAEYLGPVYMGRYKYAKKDVANGTANDYEYMLAKESRNPADPEGVPLNTNIWVKESGAATYTAGSFDCPINGTNETWAPGDAIWYTSMHASVAGIEDYGHELFQNDTATSNEGGPHFGRSSAGVPNPRPGFYQHDNSVDYCTLTPEDIYHLQATTFSDPFDNPTIPFSDPNYNP